MKRHIKITDDKFVWKIVTDYAEDIWHSGIFPLYILREDESESLIEDYEELQDVLEAGDVEIGIEVGFTYEEHIETLKQALSEHDYYYDYSDDPKAYQKGKKTLSRIVELRGKVGEQKFRELWNQRAPKKLKFVV